MADRDAEIGLARSAAPLSIPRRTPMSSSSAAAATSRAVKGTNGFVCSCGALLDGGLRIASSGIRGSGAPNWFNPRPRAASSRSTWRVPNGLGWCDAGADHRADTRRVRGAPINGPRPGRADLHVVEARLPQRPDRRPWLPHMMFFVPHGQTKSWGASRDGSPRHWRRRHRGHHCAAASGSSVVRRHAGATSRRTPHAREV